MATVIVKDMSRFGRDYLKVGYYTEVVLPGAGVRFLAVNDGVDSDRADNDFTPFRNIINEWYAKDTSKKIRAVMKTRALAGEHLTGYPPFGYMKDPANPKVWIIDEPAAEVVREIFSLYLAGNSLFGIARILNERGIDPPVVRKAQLGLNPNGGYSRRNDWRECLWEHTSISDILARMDYLGHTVSMKMTQLFLQRFLYPPGDGTHGMPLDAEILSNILRRGMQRKPRYRHLEVSGEVGIMPRPWYPRNHHPVFYAFHPRRGCLNIHPCAAQIQ